MNALVEEFQVIDTDTHIIEPPDLWTSRVSVKKWGDLVPHVKWDDEAEEEAWYFGSDRIGAVAGGAMAGWHEYPPHHPRTLDDVDPALWKADARLKRMDEYGIYAQILYPNVGGFGAGRYLGMRDPELMIQCVQAYNDWISDWSSADPKRLIPQMALPFWDLDLSIEEMTRCAKNGHRGIVFGSEPEYFGQPRLSDPHWDPLWAAAQDMGLPINFHIASGDMSLFEAMHPGAGAHASYASMGVVFFMGNARAISHIICSGICHRFPKLNFVSVESGVGWLPYALAALDWQWKNCGVPKEHPEYKLLPSEYFKRQIYGCFWFERETVAPTIDIIGPDNIMYESDFPHPTSMSPGPATTAIKPSDYINEVFSDLPRDTIEKILHGNAARIYNLG